MNTNAFSPAEFGADFSQAVLGTAVNTLGEMVVDVRDSDYTGALASALGELVVAFLVVWGVFWVTRKLIRAARATR